MNFHLPKRRKKLQKTQIYMHLKHMKTLSNSMYFTDTKNTDSLQNGELINSRHANTINSSGLHQFQHLNLCNTQTIHKINLDFTNDIKRCLLKFKQLSLLTKFVITSSDNVHKSGGRLCCTNQACTQNIRTKFLKNSRRLTDGFESVAPRRVYMIKHKDLQSLISEVFPILACCLIITSYLVHHKQDHHFSILGEVPGN